MSAACALLTLSLLLGACGKKTSSDDSISASGQGKAMVLAPGWVTGTAWPAETVVALNSVAARSTSRVDGSVGVILAGTGTFLGGATELTMEANSEITGDVRADSLGTITTSHIFGAATYNSLTGGGTIGGTRTPALTVPVPITIVTTSDFTAGTSNRSYSASSTSTLSSGSYGTITLASGTATSPTILRLSRGTYTISSITMGDYTRFECASTKSRACTIKVKDRVSIGNRSYFGPGSASATDIVMGNMFLFVEGANGTSGPAGIPPAIQVGQNSQLHTYTFAPNGTLVLGAGCTGAGKYIAKDVDIGADTELMTGSKTQSVALTTYAVGPTWPKEVLTAFNSVFLLSNSSMTGDMVVIRDGSGSFLSTSEAVIEVNGMLTGNLKADKIELKTGASITGTASYNTIVNAGTVGTSSTPLTMPVDVSVPVFPVVSSGSSTRTIASQTNQTLAPGKYRDIILSAGTTTDYTELTLTGGLYQFRAVTLGTYSKLLCATACEIRVARNIAAGDFTEIGPGAGIDPSEMQVFVYGYNNNSSTAGPNTSPFAMSVGQNSAATGLFFVQRGTLEGKASSTFSGRFIARDIKLLSGTTSVVAGAVELAPEIQTQPVDVELVQGQPATFSVAATGTDVTLQWKRNNVAIPGATSGSYTLATTALADSGALFSVTVTNAVGSVTSTAALLTVNSCDPGTYVPSATSCGVGACASTGMLTCVDGAVVDSCLAGTPAANDTTCNGIDENCNGLADEEYVPLATTCGIGACSDTGVTSCVGGAVRNSCTSDVPAANDATCDGRDDDCNGQIDEDWVNVATSCGEGACIRTGVLTCVGGAPSDSCVEGNPGPSDSNCNGVDEDCNGVADQDYVSVATSCGAGACAATGVTDCVNGAVTNSCQAGTNAPNDATCNGVDDDCNGQVDEDYVPVSTSCGLGMCTRTGTRTCVSGVYQDSCTAGTPAANDASCNGQDNDCNGQVDEDYVATTTSCGVGTCSRTGTATCVSGSVQNSCVAGAPGPSDTNCNGLDENCNGTADEGYPTTPTTCGVGACTASGTLSCSGGTTRNSCVAGTQQPSDATCNGVDDDCNGQIDEDFVTYVTNCGSGGCATTGMMTCSGGSPHDSCAPSTTDTDGDSLADCTDLCPADAMNDEDGDGLCADADNCDSAFNPDQLDTDGDLAGNACDAPVMIEVAAGGSHSCALFQDNVVRCWGDNTYGQLGNGLNVTVASLVQVSGVTDAQAIAAGKSHSCARLATGAVSCWGDNATGQLGNGSTSASNTPVGVSGVTNATQVAAGDGHTCARLATGEVMCWGDNQYGQLGVGTLVSSSTAVAVPGITDAVHIASGLGHTCAAHASGAVSCWGYNSNGQVGDGTAVDAMSPVAVPGIVGAEQVATGVLHTCAKLSTGAVSCWGANWYGQLGDGTTVSSLAPVAVAAASDVVDIVAGQLHSCALTATGSVRCWGYNPYGSLGNGTLTDSATPVAVSGLANAVQLSAGGLHNCAVRATGQVACWGNGEKGQLGQGMLGTALVPSLVIGVANARSVATGPYDTCALQSSGSILCWGVNGAGELGNGTLVDSNTPTLVTGISDATEIAMGDSHACALRASGTVYCWGFGAEGQLGNGAATNSHTPVAAAGISTAVAIATGADHSCAVLADGTVRCWGYGTEGELGDGSTAGSPTPVLVAGITDAVSVAAGVSHTCARSSTGSVRCWGHGQHGRLGDGTTTSSTTPVLVSGLNDAIFIAAGDAHTCAVRASSEVRCWGDNAGRQVGLLGGGPPGSHSVLMPEVVAGLANAQTVAAGSLHTCATLASGQIRCWGNNREAQLGNGTLITPSATTLVSNISDAVSVSASVVHTCAVSSTGTVSCWGNGDTGRLGNAYPWSNLPVRVIWP